VGEPSKSTAPGQPEAAQIPTAGAPSAEDPIATPQEPPVATERQEEVVITGTGYTEPQPSITLANHTEPAASEKQGKTTMLTQDYSFLSLNELYSSYLNRLHTSRDMEAGFVKMMKDQYEVNI
jgi:hypothetical protein